MCCTVAIVWPCSSSVEEYAAAGRAVRVPRVDCPDCGRPMGLWSGYERYLRLGRVHRVWVRRAKCRPCRVTHALVPSFVLLRRLDAVEVIGVALERAVAGAGLRPVAAGLDVPHTTARDWRRRFRARAPALAVGLAALVVERGGGPPGGAEGGGGGARGRRRAGGRDGGGGFRAGAPAVAVGFAALVVEVGGAARALPAGSEVAALAALGAAAWQVRYRAGALAPTRWRLGAVVTGGGWLATTTSPPWAGLGGRCWLPPVP